MEQRTSQSQNAPSGFERCEMWAAARICMRLVGFKALTLTDSPWKIATGGTTRSETLLASSLPGVHDWLEPEEHAPERVIQKKTREQEDEESAALSNRLDSYRFGSLLTRNKNRVSVCGVVTPWPKSSRATNETATHVLWSSGPAV